MIEFVIRTKDPRSHIEACSLISYLGCEIISDAFLDRKDGLYGEFKLRGTEEAFNLFTQYSIGIITENVE